MADSALTRLLALLDLEQIERLAKERGIDVPHAGLEKLDALWDEAKRAEL